MDRTYDHLLRAVLAQPWAIYHDSLAWGTICEILAMRAHGELLSLEQIEARLAVAAAANGPRAGASRSRNVAVIPVYGTIAPRTSGLMASGGTTAGAILNDFRAAMSDPDIDGIVFDVDSPGGVVEGIDELAGEIMSARGVKPMAANANHMAASAAYWAMVGVDEFHVSPSGSVGSIGIFTAHQDLTEAMAQKGVKQTIISAGKYKAEGALGSALTEEAIAAVQEQVDAYYAMMTTRIAQARGVPVATVRDGFGEGRTVLAKKAVDQGMADRVATLDETIRRVARGAVGAPSTARAISHNVMWGSDPEHAPAGLGSGLPFAERLELVSAEAEALAQHARERADLRAAEGRELSEATRTGLRSTAEALLALATEPEPEPEPEPTPDPQPQGRNVSLELYEAALTGGYRLDN